MKSQVGIIWQILGLIVDNQHGVHGCAGWDAGVQMMCTFSIICTQPHYKLVHSTNITYTSAHAILCNYLFCRAHCGEVHQYCYGSTKD